MAGVIAVPEVRTAPALVAGAVVACLSALLVLLPSGAAAHESGAGVRYRLVEVSPEVDGLVVQVVRGLAGQLVLANETGSVVEVLDGDGEPFLRIGPDGVKGDVASAAWRSSDRPFGLADDGPVPGGAEPQWIALSSGTSWGWYDHRMHGEPVAAPSEATSQVVVDQWEVPLRVDGRSVAVRGETVAGPPAGSVVARLTSDRELQPGVRATLLPGAVPGLLLEVDDGHEALVRGEAGEPFLWFHDGRVQANTASPTWHRVGGQADPTDVDAAAEPTWQAVGDAQRLGWIEPRASAAVPEDPPADGTVLSTWAVPVEIDGRTTTIVGELRWVARRAAEAGEGGLPWLDVAMAAGGIAVVGALLVVRRREAGQRRAAR